MHSTGNYKTILTNSRSSTTGNSSFPSTNKHSTRRKNVIAVDTLSHSEEVIGHRHKKNAFKALSDYESGDNDIEEAGSSLATFSRANIRGVPEKTSIKDSRCTNIQFDELSSSDSDELCTKLNGNRGSMRTLSDYETGDSIEQAKVSSNLSRVNQNLYNSMNSFQQNDDLDLSSENDSIYKITRNALKKKRPHNLLSTSDSSDSDTPVLQQRFRKRKRINSSSEDENFNAAHTQRRGRPSQNDLLRTNELVHTRPQMTRQLRPIVNNQSLYRATVSGSSSYEILDRMMRRDIDGSRATISSNSSQGNSTDSSSSDDQLRSRVTLTRITESFQLHTIPPMVRTQIIRRTRQSRGRIRVRGSVTISAIRRGSETSSDESSEFTGFDIEPQPLQSSIDSSDSDTTLPFAARRARGGTVQLRYSDSDSNSEQTLLHVIDYPETGNSSVSLNPLIPSIIPSNDSSDSDADSEKCPICFGSFGSKEVASPDSCAHSFCTKCIEEWAKNNNTCPVDRTQFNKIVVSRSFNNNEVLREIPVQSPRPGFRFWDIGIDEYEGEESTTDLSEEICCVCFSSANSHNLISCDFCYNIYHLSCLTPPLRYVPANLWFCPQCTRFDLSE